MANLHETSNQQHKAQIDIDTVGWLFAAFVVVITAIAAMVAYEGNNTMVAKITVSHVAAPPSSGRPVGLHSKECAFSSFAYLSRCRAIRFSNSSNKHWDPIAYVRDGANT